MITMDLVERGLPHLPHRQQALFFPHWKRVLIKEVRVHSNGPTLKHKKAVLKNQLAVIFAQQIPCPY
jgi:hypothetical protein